MDRCVPPKHNDFDYYCEEGSRALVASARISIAGVFSRQKSLTDYGRMDSTNQDTRRFTAAGSSLHFQSKLRDRRPELDKETN